MPLRWIEGKPLRFLDFDIENRPLSYWVPDRPSAEITAIAWGWTDQTRVTCRLLGKHSMKQILEDFRAAFNEADGVTGHYIRKHDLPIINGAMAELGLDLLGPKLTSDTRLDLPKIKDLPLSQEALGAMYDLERPKYHMSQPDWREANRLTPEGLRQTRKRVVADVRQHKVLRERLLGLGLLGPPRTWHP